VCDDGVIVIDPDAVLNYVYEGENRFETKIFAGTYSGAKNVRRTAIISFKLLGARLFERRPIRDAIAG